jgi:hypothetical protein
LIDGQVAGVNSKIGKEEQEEAEEEEMAKLEQLMKLISR